jgi:hypothetical protein
MRASHDHTVLAHGPIEQLEENLFRVEGSVSRMALKRVMAVVRLADGGLLIHSAVALEGSAMAQLEALGTPAVLVVPNRFHRMDAAFYKQRYPQLRVLCPHAARTQVQRRVAVDGDCTSLSDPNVSLEYIEGTNEAEAVMIVRSPGGVSLVFTDLIFNMPHQPGLQGWVVKHIFGSSGGPRVSRLGKLAIVKDAAAVRVHLERLAKIPGLRRVLVAHHETIAEDAAGTLRAVAAAL